MMYSNKFLYVTIQFKDVLMNYLQTTYFSIQLDESTLSSNDESLLLAYVRFVID